MLIITIMIKATAAAATTTTTPTTTPTAAAAAAATAAAAAAAATTATATATAITIITIAITITNNNIFQEPWWQHHCSHYNDNNDNDDSNQSIELVTVGQTPLETKLFEASTSSILGHGVVALVLEPPDDKIQIWRISPGVAASTSPQNWGNSSEVTFV